MQELLWWTSVSSSSWPVLTSTYEILVLYVRFVFLSVQRKLLGMRCFIWDLEMDTTVKGGPAGPGRQVWHSLGYSGCDPPSSVLTLMRFARLMSSAVMVLCVGTVLPSCCGCTWSTWFSCCSSAACGSGGTGVCSCCSSPFSGACPASSNCPLLEKCSKSWNCKSYNQWLFPPPTEKHFDNTQQTTRFLHI